MEIIFAIVILGVIASVAIPKFMSTKSDASASTLMQDIRATSTSVQSHYIVNGSISKISDAISLNSNTWTISDLKVDFLEDGESCVSLEIVTSGSNVNLVQTINTNHTGAICTKLQTQGIRSDTFKLN